jgi:hypothetical protein
MAKRKQIVKFLERALEEEKKYFAEDNQLELDDLRTGILYGISLAKVMIKNKRDKDHDYF